MMLLKHCTVAFLFFYHLTTFSHKNVWIVIHGTFAKNASWYQKGGSFFETLKQQLPATIQLQSFTWSGKNSDKAREKAAESLVKEITKNNHPEDVITIVGHSHGCNVALRAAQLLAIRYIRYKIHTLFALAPPVCLFRYAPAMDTIKYLFNFFSYGDQIQTVLQIFKRVFPEHERIWNIQLQHNGRCPEHSNMHSPELAVYLPTMQTLLLKNQTAVVHLFPNKPPIIEYDTNRVWDLEQDRRFTEQLIATLGDSRTHRNF